MEKLSKFVVSRLAQRQGQQAGDHPEADMLAAFAEGALPVRERATVLAHLAQCPACREVTALSSAENDREVALPSPYVQRGAAWWRWRWAAAVAIGCLVLAVVWRPEFLRQSQPHPPAPTAAVTRAPGMEAPPPAPAPSEAPKPVAPPSRKLLKKPSMRTASPKVNSEALSDAVPEAMPPPPPPSLVPRAGLLPQQQVQSFAPDAVSPRRSRIAVTSDRHDESLWRLAEGREGTVQRSQDGGQTWQTVRVDNGSQLYALSVEGPEIWAGGAEGALFHSVDNGGHWTPVVVADNGRRLRDAITRIDVNDKKVVRLKTQGGGSWVTTDDGGHWRVEF